MDELAKTFKDRIIVVTGGLGSIGEEIVNQLLTYGPAQVRIFDNRETELFYAREKYAKHDNVRFLQGDVRDSTRIRRATEGADIIFHAAALKHVMLCEFDPFEAIKTNVLGAQNLVEAALTNDVGKVILISTDKAISPSNVMGATAPRRAAHRLDVLHAREEQDEVRCGPLRERPRVAGLGARDMGRPARTRPEDHRHRPGDDPILHEHPAERQAHLRGCCAG